MLSDTCRWIKTTATIFQSHEFINRGPPLHFTLNLFFIFNTDLNGRTVMPSHLDHKLQAQRTEEDLHMLTVTDSQSQDTKHRSSLGNEGAHERLMNVARGYASCARSAPRSPCVLTVRPAEDSRPQVWPSVAPRLPHGYGLVWLPHPMQPCAHDQMRSSPLL